jgi:shingomyelin synthase
MLQVLSFGQGTAGVCGDMLFSGHTMLCTVCILFTHRYTPRPHRIYLLCILWPLLVVIVVLLLISRSHYTVDILFGYWLAIGLFVIYHMYCEMKAGKRRLRSEAQMLFVTLAFEVRMNF